MKINWKFATAMGVLVLIMLGILYSNLTSEKEPEGIPRDFCNIVEDCALTTCCHAEGVVNKNYAPDCKNIFCTQECSGPLDCGAGYIDCIENKCVIVPNY